MIFLDGCDEAHHRHAKFCFSLITLELVVEVGVTQFGGSFITGGVTGTFDTVWTPRSKAGQTETTRRDASGVELWQYSRALIFETLREFPPALEAVRAALIRDRDG